MRAEKTPRPTPPWIGTRSAVLERLLTALLDDPEVPFHLTSRDVSDPTVAILDAWATVSDVLSFYEERIRTEGYIGTAVQPESVLALLGLTAIRPRPPIGATVDLVYVLHEDPADLPVVLAEGLLSQTVPGPGEQLQTFETSAELTARASWNRLKVLSARPLVNLSAATSTPAGTWHIPVAGAAAGVTAGDCLVWREPASDPRVLRVVRASVDAVSDSTQLVVADSQSQDYGNNDEGGTAGEGPLEGGSSNVSPSWPMDTLRGIQDVLTRRTSEETRRGSATVDDPFGPLSENIPRLMATLQPDLAPSLYDAIATSRRGGGAALPTLEVLRVSAAPFGANAPRQPVFDVTGRQSGTAEWPLTGVLELSLRIVGASGAVDGLRSGDSNDASKARAVAPLGLRASVSATADGEPAQHAAVTIDGLPDVELGTFGTLTATVVAGELTVVHTHPVDEPLGFTMVVTAEAADQSVRFAVGSSSCVWFPSSDQQQLDAEVGHRRLRITYSEKADELLVTLRTPLRSVSPTVIHLDTRYEQIVPGSTVVVTRADGSAPEVRTVRSAETVAVAKYGMAAEVTRLALDGSWAESASTLSDLRAVRVHAGAQLLTVLPAVETADIAGARIELDGVHAGLDPGRRLIITGRRSDLGASAVAAAGEVVEVASVELSADPGGVPFTILSLTAALEHTYQRESVTVHGNVVRAHQGATLVETLGAGDARQAHQTFALASSPVLATVSPTGVASSLAVHVDGQRYREVSRISDSTPAASYLCGLDAAGHTTVTFAAPLPLGTGNVVAHYRAGNGGQGNVRAGQVSQLLTKPLAVTEVVNPLPASGGADPEGPDEMRRRVGIGLRSLGHEVTVADYVDTARTWPGVGKASAWTGANRLARAIHLDVAGTSPAPLRDESDLVVGLAASLGGQERSVAVEVRAVDPLVMVLRVRVKRAPDRTWESVARATRAALGERFAYADRALGQDVLVSDLLAAAHTALGVVACSVTGLVLLPPGATPDELSVLSQSLDEEVLPRTRIRAASTNNPDGTIADRAQVAFIDLSVPNSVIVEEWLT